MNVVLPHKIATQIENHYFDDILLHSAYVTQFRTVVKFYLYNDLILSVKTL